MQKLYYGLLIFIILLGGAINLGSFLAGFDKMQLKNISFFKERVEAEWFYMLNIIFESGIYLTNTDAEKIDKFRMAAAEKYNIDHNTLLLLTNRDKEFTISLTGGMGLTAICPAYFNTTPYTDPFNTEQNINATALTIKNLIENNQSDYGIFTMFLSCGKPEKVKMLYPQLYHMAEMMDETYKVKAVDDKD